MLPNTVFRAARFLILMLHSRKLMATDKNVQHGTSESASLATEYCFEGALSTMKTCNPFFGE